MDRPYRRIRIRPHAGRRFGEMETFEVLEVASFAKTGVDRLNEDSYAVTDHAAAVFDGATDKKGSAPPTPGRLAAQALGRGGFGNRR